MQRRRLLSLATAGLAACSTGPRTLPEATARRSSGDGACSGSDAALCALLARAGQDGSNTHAVLVQRGEQTLAEAYFTGRDRPSGQWFWREQRFGPDDPHDMRSITKSVTGLVAGIVQAQGRLPLDRPVLDALPDLAGQAAPGWTAVTVQHLLDMTVGWPWDETDIPYDNPANSESAMTRAPDRDRFLLGLPIQHPPGTRWAYSGGATALLATLLERATGQGLPDLTQALLFDPLGIPRPTWRTDPQGRALAFSGLRLRPRELARIGQMLLADGRWQGAQVVPAPWLADGRRQQVRAAGGMGYGRQWWYGRFADGPGAGPAFTAGMGNGGQRLFVVPALQAVVVMTAGRYNQPGNGVPASRLFRAVLAHLQAG